MMSRFGAGMIDSLKALQEISRSLYPSDQHPGVSCSPLPVITQSYKLFVQPDQLQFLSESDKRSYECMDNHHLSNTGTRRSEHSQKDKKKEPSTEREGAFAVVDTAPTNSVGGGKASKVLNDEQLKLLAAAVESGKYMKNSKHDWRKIRSHLVSDVKFAGVVELMKNKDFLRNSYWNNKSYIEETLSGNKRTRDQRNASPRKRASDDEVDVEAKANGGRLDVEKSTGGGLDDVDPSILIQMIEQAESKLENDESYRKIVRAMDQMVSFTSKEKLTPADFSNHVLKVDSRCKRNKFSEDEFSLMRYIKSEKYSRIKTDGKSIHWESFLTLYEALAKKIDKYYSSCDTLGEISLYQRDKSVLMSRAKMYFKTLKGK